jgi:hypothetical protein
MYGVIGEDKSDVATIKVLIKRLAGNDALTIHTKGYEGCAQMLKKGAAQLRLFASKPMDCRRFVICHDADRALPAERRSIVIKDIVAQAGELGAFCVLIPVQEIESWILADIQAVQKIVKSWQPKEIMLPESINDPKEHLEKLSRDSQKRPRYSHATHNEKVAAYLDLERVYKKCPSFPDLHKFVVKKEPNYQFPKIE